MKTKFIIGTLILGCTLFACESHINDKEDENFIIPDKGLDIDDDKTHQTPVEGDKPTTPGDVGDTPSISDSIPMPGQGEEPPVAPPIVALDTKYIKDCQQDTTWTERESHVLDSHIVIQSGGELEMIESWSMEDDATITIEVRTDTYVLYSHDVHHVVEVGDGILDSGLACFFQEAIV